MSITHTYTKPTLATLVAEHDRNLKEQQDRQQRINDCLVEDTDCALSMWSAGVTESKNRCMMDLAKNGWKHTYNVLCKDGVPVKGRGVSTRFGYRWNIDGKWLPAYHPTDTGRRLSNFNKLGFTWVEMELDSHVAQQFGSYVGAPAFAFPKPDNQDIIAV